MIQKEEYLKALEIVEQYHKQLELQIVRHCEKLPDNDISKLKIGEYIKCVKDVKPAKYFTAGKKYLIIGKNEKALQIRHDRGNTYWIGFRNTYRRWGC